MPDDLFQTEAWFDHLLAQGFEHAPTPYVLPLGGASGFEGAPPRLHLMQAAPGGPLLALSNYYSCLYGPVGAVAHLTPADWRAAAMALKALPGSAVVRLQPLDAGSPWLPALELGLRAAGYAADRYFAFGNWFHRVPEGGFERYWAGRPSALRHSVERGRRRLDKVGAPWRIEIVCGPSERLERAVAAYETVYARSWKSPEKSPGFMPGLIRMAADQGWLRLGLLWLGGEPVAAQVWLVHGTKANIYKLAYAEGHEKLSVGSVLTTALMQHAMDVDRVVEVDYLSGDDPYKADWMAGRRERIGLVACDLHRVRGAWAWVAQRLGAFKRTFTN